MANHQFVKIEVNVTDVFLTKFSEMYVKQRSEVRFDYSSLDRSLLFQASGFDSTHLESVITKNSVAADLIREAGEKHKTVLTDIYRSDFGELLMTYYFEEKIGGSERFKIPLKNIANRELAAQPGRGLDAIGYRIDDTERIQLLIGEAKVSHQKKNPPDVVDYSNDSIHATQLKFKNNKKLLINRLTDYSRRLAEEDLEKIGLVILLMEFDRDSEYDLIFGCSLIRDLSCVKITEDFGKFYTQQTDFEPHQVTFCILNMSNDIGTAIDSFYNKVQEYCAR